MKGYECIFADGVTLEQVNPDGYALKSPYMDGLFATCLAILPIVDRCVTGIRIVRGFYCRAKLYGEVLVGGAKATPLQIKHTKGQAIELTWDGYSYDSALIVAKTLFDEQAANIHYIIGDESLACMRKMDNKKIIRNTNDSSSVILSSQE